MSARQLDGLPTAAAIFVKLGRDSQHATCGLARESGPDATFACANCGRAQWMHSTRHDTCGQFCWVTERSLTDRQIGQLACSRACNDYALAPYYVQQARQTCAAAIDNAKRDARKGT
jgi:hypothetical protein